MAARNDGVVLLTPRGKKKLEDELYTLRTDKRDEIAAFMQSILEEGDISENSGYDDARAKMGALESRISELEDLLLKAQVVEEAENANSVSLGSTVDVEGPAGRTLSFSIVGTHEVDALRGQISDESPMGLALLGRKVGDQVSVPTPRGNVAYTVKAIRLE